MKLKDKIMMFKKCALASAIAVIVVPAQAATFQAWVPATDRVVVEHTNEGIEGVADTTGHPTSTTTVLLGAEYAQNDLFTFTLSQPTRSNYAWPTSLKSQVAGTATVANEYELKGACNTDDTSMDLDLTVNGVSAFATNADLLIGETFKFGAVDTTTTHTITVVAAPTITFTPGCSTTIADTTEIAVQKKAAVTMGLVNSDATSATYRVSAINTTAPNGTSTIGAQIQVPAVEVKSSSLTAAGTTGITVSTSATTGAGTPMDTNSGTAVIAKSKAQYPVTITKFNNIVDVEQSNLAFSDGNSTASQDCVDFNTTAVTATAGESVLINGSGVLSYNEGVTASTSTAATVTHTVLYSGGLSFLDTTPATAGLQGTPFTAGTDNAYAVTADTAMTTITAVDATAINTGTTPLCINKTIASNTIPTGSFSGSSKYTWTNSAGTTGKTSTTTHASLGSWSLNGASVTVYGVPMGSTVDRMIWVNNKGSLDAVLTASYTAAGVTTDNLALGTATALSSSSVDEALDTALAGAGITPAANSRATVTITAPVKSADLVISAAYKVTSANDRLSLETSDTIDDTYTQTGLTATSK